jgi:hypothetical protein
MKLFTATRKLKSFFLQQEMLVVFIQSNKVHINAIFKFLPHTCKHGYNNPCLNARIIAAVKNIDASMLTRV